MVAPTTHAVPMLMSAARHRHPTPKGRAKSVRWHAFTLCSSMNSSVQPLCVALSPLRHTLGPKQKALSAETDRALKIWLRGPDLNQRPSGYEPDELPDCSTPRHKYYNKLSMIPNYFPFLGTL